MPLTSSSCNPLFTNVDSPNSSLPPTFNELDSVAAISPTDIWAVGSSNAGATTSRDRTLAEHWNGTNWVLVATPPNAGDGNNDLNGVAAIDSNDVWAVGRWQSGGVNYGLALHWNGSAWAGSSIPQPSASDQQLGGVSGLASNDVWAVGYYVSGGLVRSLAQHWNGSAWSTVPTPNLGTATNVLENVVMRASNDVWAVGFYRASPGTARLTLIEHWDGTSWSTQTSPSPVTGDNVLFNVSATSATDVWAVGYTNDGTPTAPHRQTLTEHLVAGTWNPVASLNIGTGDNVLYGVVAVSPTSAWAVGTARSTPTSTSPWPALAEHWDGTTWTLQSTQGDAFFGVAALPGNNVWAVGASFGMAPPSEYTQIEHFQLPAPTGVTATPADQSAAVSWTAPLCDGGIPITGYKVTAYDGCTVQASMSTSTPTPTNLTFTGLTNGSPFNFTVQAVSASLGAETPSAASPAVIPTGATVPVALSACSSKQYQYVSPDPATFADMDAVNLKLSVTPSVDSLATITANTDLWTANAGLNQDIGIFVSGGAFGTGQVVGWKESGGFAGTFSPNAAAVQSVVTLVAGTAYTVKLQWKSNMAFPGAAIFAGAGPLPGGVGFTAGQVFSPTRLSMELHPVVGRGGVFTTSTTRQYTLPNSDGTSWVDIDSVGLSKQISPAAASVAVITGNVDLWTANAGFNQDVAITVDGAIVAWKESGGFAGTFSPNAAFVQAVVPLTLAGSPHTVKLQWKTNKPASGATIYAGAGPWPSPATFSPTRLTVALQPGTSVSPAVSTLQYGLPNSDGAGWTPIDSTTLKLSLAPAAGSYSYALAGNADLWTANAGFNQDIGIFVSGGVYGSGTLVAWKESGGFAGTFSPNAAYVETLQHLQGGVTYIVWLAWKTNQQGAGSTIFAAAGPLPTTTSYSPTRLTAVQLSSP